MWVHQKRPIRTVRYASGQIAKKYKQNVKIRTPATIGVRGTDFYNGCRRNGW